MSIWGRLETQGRDAVLGGPSFLGSRLRAGPGPLLTPSHCSHLVSGCLRFL